MGSNARRSFLDPDIYVPDVKQVGIRGPHYNPAVLIGEWFEERCSSETDPKAGIPGIYGKSGCTKDISIYNSAFTQPLKDNSHEIINNFIDWKLKGLSNRLATEATNIRFSDDVGFDKNATRTVDIRYHILPEQEALGRTKADKRSCSEGGTKFQLLRSRACRLFKESHTPVYMSSYQNNFKGIQIKVHRKIKPHALKRKQDNK
ncbi:hypothetical protein GQX74_013670 [Glossina fuscipes]|uniref:Uncharacterized protein n=1 Tax=Glossina palpalis gambiensis TaxID=67801 RepID=A0A1B0BS19_9MUSC|nr:hypothetical protein GQX74_013670 [Glossina fuscipes]